MRNNKGNMDDLKRVVNYLFAISPKRTILMKKTDVKVFQGALTEKYLFSVLF